MKFEKHVPLHVQIKDILEDEILKGVYNEKIPGELELMERFSVSRSTIRQAIAELVEEGILQKKHGKGTFVSFKPVEEWLGNFSTYKKIIEKMGMQPNIKLLNKKTTTTPAEVSDILGEEEFYNVKRIRYADDIPISIADYYYPLEIGKKISKYDLNNVATYELLEKIGFTLWDAKQIITCKMPTEEECRLLEIPDTLPVLYIERINYDKDGNTVEYEQSIYRSDKYAFIVKMGRSKS